MPAKQDDFEIRVPCGETLNTAVSVLIKELRRGKDVESVYWARQIEKVAYKYVWRRLLIFATEDVGIANPDAIVQVTALREAYLAIRSENSKKHVDGDVIVMAVLILARSPKNREVDHLKNVVGAMESRGWRPEVPEYAIDGHTALGRQRTMTKTEKALEWYFTASYCENEVGPLDARLWLWRSLADQGHLDRFWVEEQAQEWENRGLLVYGAEGRWPRPEEIGPSNSVADSGQARLALGEEE